MSSSQSSTPLKLGILASHRGSTAAAIFTAIAQNQLQAQVVVLISNNSTAAAMELARAQHIPALHISNHTHGEENRDQAIAAALSAHGAQLVVCAGYMKKLTTPLLTAFADRIINVHPSLLPAFGGEGMYGDKVHAAVLAAACKESGATVHLVDAMYDHGSNLAQQAVPVYQTDSVETLRTRVQTAERQLYPKTIQSIAMGERLPYIVNNSSFE